MTPCNAELRRLQPGDGHSLAAFYNGLSEASIRTFRPLGAQTTPDTCESIALKNTETGVNYDLVACQNDTIVGWAFIWNLSDDQPTFGLGIADAFHRQGLGSRLMDAVMAEAQRRKLPKVYLTAVKDNDIAWQMYARRGFVQYDEKLSDNDGLMYRHMLAEL